MDLLTDMQVFLKHPCFDIIDKIATVGMFLGVCYTAYLIIRGILPVLYRLGLGLSMRKVAIFASTESYESLKATLVDSKIFKQKNIVHIKKDNIDKAKNESLFLVDWETFENKIDDVFSARKSDQTAVIIYAQPSSIPNERMSQIGNRANTVVVNFRGRLLNDILTSLITTSFDRKS